MTANKLSEANWSGTKSYHNIFPAIVGLYLSVQTITFYEGSGQLLSMLCQYNYKLASAERHSQLSMTIMAYIYIILDYEYANYGL